MNSEVRFFDQYNKKKLSYYLWRTQSGVMAKIALACSLACLTGLLAQVKFFLPWTPVPIVASQIGVILAAVLLGKKWGGISMLIYALGGAAGIPWFAGNNGGLAALAGPTGGYILGFILAALFMGSLFDTKVGARKTLPLTAAILFAQLVLVYVPGLIHLYFWTGAVTGQQATVIGILWMGFIPFVAGDIIKSLIGAGIAKAVITKEKF